MAYFNLFVSRLWNWFQNCQKHRLTSRATVLHQDFLLIHQNWTFADHSGLTMEFVGRLVCHFEMGKNAQRNIEFLARRNIAKFVNLNIIKLKGNWMKFKPFEYSNCSDRWKLGLSAVDSWMNWCTWPTYKHSHPSTGHNRNGPNNRNRARQLWPIIGVNIEYFWVFEVKNCQNFSPSFSSLTK